MSYVNLSGIRLALGQVYSVLGRAELRRAQGGLPSSAQQYRSSGCATSSSEKRNCLLAVQFQSNSRG